MKKIKIILIIIGVLSLVILGINGYVIMQSKDEIKKVGELKEEYDIILILGAGTKNGEPSLMLKDRLDKAIEIYTKGLGKKILITGDENNHEVTVMNKYLIDNNIPSNAIVKDEIGYSTSESLTNYKEKYKHQKVIIVSQNYHLYRALYIAKKLNIKGVGVSAKKKNYQGFIYRNIREILARNKDFFKYLS